jgi:hypothetical protein
MLMGDLADMMLFVTKQDGLVCLTVMMVTPRTRVIGTVGRKAQANDQGKVRIGEDVGPKVMPILHAEESNLASQGDLNLIQMLREDLADMMLSVTERVVLVSMTVMMVTPGTTVIGKVGRRTQAKEQRRNRRNHQNQEARVILRLVRGTIRTGSQVGRKVMSNLYQEDWDLASQVNLNLIQMLMGDLADMMLFVTERVGLVCLTAIVTPGTTVIGKVGRKSQAKVRGRILVSRRSQVQRKARSQSSRVSLSHWQSLIPSCLCLLTDRLLLQPIRDLRSDRPLWVHGDMNLMNRVTEANSALILTKEDSRAHSTVMMIRTSRRGYKA